MSGLQRGFGEIALGVGGKAVATAMSIGLLHLPALADEAVRAYWTKEAIESAVPMGFPIVTNEAGVYSFAGESEQSAPSPPADDQFDLGKRADVNVPPFYAGGKLFFTRPSGSDHSCTAEFVAPDILLTAAHCVYAFMESGYNSRVMFFLRFDGVGTDYYPTECVVVPSQFIGNGDMSYDYAFIRTTKNFNGNSIKLAAYVREYGGVQSIGYPSNFYNAKYMYRFVGDVSRFNEKFNQISGNPMGGGSSGGAWIAYIEREFWAVGLNSFADPRDAGSNIVISPVFDDDFFDYYQKAVDRVDCIRP